MKLVAAALLCLIALQGIFAQPSRATGATGAPLAETGAVTGAEQATGATGEQQPSTAGGKNLTNFNARPIEFGYAYNISAKEQEGNYFVLDHGITKANTYKFLVSLDLDKETTATVKFVPIRPDDKFEGDWKNIVTSQGDCLEVFDKVPMGQKFLFQVKITCPSGKNCSNGLFGLFLKGPVDFEPFSLVNNKQVAEFNLQKKHEWGPTAAVSLSQLGSLYIRARLTNANESLARNDSKAILAFIAWSPQNDSSFQVDFNFTKNKLEETHMIPDLVSDYQWLVAPQLIKGKNISFIWVANQNTKPNELISATSEAKANEAAEAAAAASEEASSSHEQHSISVHEAADKPKPGKSKKVKPEDEEDEEQKEGAAAAHGPAFVTIAAALVLAFAFL